MPAGIEARFQTSEQEVVAATVWLMTRVSSVQQDRARAIRVFLRFAALALLVVALGTYLGSRDLGTAIRVFLGALVIVAVGAYLLVRRPSAKGIAAATRRRITSGLCRHLFGATVSAIDAEGLTVDRPLKRALYRWPAVLSIDDAESHIIFTLVGGEVETVPHRAFASPAEKAEYLNSATRWWQAARPSTLTP